MKNALFMKISLNRMMKGLVDNNLYVKIVQDKQLVVIVYVDDIIFGGNDEELCRIFAAEMTNEFEMSKLGEL